MTDLEKELLAVLKEAQEHLDYCNYGDSWERECAMSDKLPQKMEEVIRKAENARL